MKQLVLVGILSAALVGVGHAQTAPAAKKAPSAQKASGNVLGTITLPANVTANGEALKKGTYQVRLSSEEVKPAAGASAEGEKWVEFVQGGQVKGKELASVYPNSDKPTLTEDKQAPPAPGQARVQLLKEKHYYRVWLNKGGNSYLLHLPPA